MDWPVIGVVTVVVIVGGAVTYEAVELLHTDTTPAPRPSLLASYGNSVERSASDIPGFASSGTQEKPLSFPLIRLIDPDRLPAPEKTTTPGVATKSSEPRQKPEAAAPELRPKSTPATQEPAKAAPAGEVKVARATPADVIPVQPRLEQWRVVPTANASYFNLGGHIDKAGVVDSLASGYLRDALKQHSHFPQLPADIKTHILTQNINLPKIAPYRTLLGMDDKTLEQEQAVRFERIR